MAPTPAKGIFPTDSLRAGHAANRAGPEIGNFSRSGWEAVPASLSSAALRFFHLLFGAGSGAVLRRWSWLAKEESGYVSAP